MRLTGVLLCLYMLCLLTGCTAETERLLADRTRGRAVTVAALGRSGQEELRSLLEKAVARLVRDPGDETQAWRAGLLLETLLGQPGGREHVLSALLRLRKAALLHPHVKAGMAALGRLHAEWLLREAFQPVSAQNALLRPELVTVAALHTGTNGRSLFVRALADYALQPELFHPAFSSLPLRDFQRLADFSRPELRKLALDRLRRKYPPGGDVLSLLKKIAADGLPVLAVFFAEELFAPARARYQVLRPRDPELRVVRQRAMHLYWFLTGLRRKFEGRSEEEGRLYGLIVKQVYDVQSGQ